MKKLKFPFDPKKCNKVTKKIEEQQCRFILSSSFAKQVIFVKTQKDKKPRLLG
jgi:hypothetical protein